MTLGTAKIDKKGTRFGNTALSATQARRLTLAGLALPSILLMVAINGYPILFAAFQSMYDGSLLNWGEFVGFGNYAEVFRDPAFWRAVRFTVIFTMAGVLGSWAVGFGLALLMLKPFPGRALFRVLLLLPWIVPIVVSSMSWNWLLATPYSLLPQAVEAIGLGRVMFLADPTMAMITVCVFKVWISYPFMLMIMGGALQAIDKNVMEAAEVDGCSGLRRLRHMILPMTARTTYIAWILMVFFSVNDFPTIYLLTGGGPLSSTTTLIVMAYRTVFQDFLPGYGVAISFIVTIALVALSIFLLRQIRKSSLQ